MRTHPKNSRLRRGAKVEGRGAGGGGRGARVGGASLIVWIGVIAVLAILLAFLIPYLIREIDYRVARKESDTLKTFGSSLQAAIQRHGIIPYEADWARIVAAEAGFELSSVTNNTRHRPRVLLLDEGGWLTNFNQSYTQVVAGTALLPVKARMMIVSSLGQPLPLTAGLFNAGDFSNLWMAAEGTASFPTTGPWLNWSGRSADVKIERVNLAPLFVSLYLMTYRSEPAPGRYSIGSDNTAYTAAYESDQVPVPPRYYLAGTTLHLRNSSDPYTLDSTQLLIRDGSYMYQNGIWKSSAAGGNMPGGVDLAGVVAAFLDCVPNTEARYGPDQQRLVVMSMMDYMSNYIAWAEGGFVDDDLHSYLVNYVQPKMISTCQEIFQGAFYPTNATGPQ